MDSDLSRVFTLVIILLIFVFAAGFFMAFNVTFVSNNENGLINYEKEFLPQEKEIKALEEAKVALAVAQAAIAQKQAAIEQKRTEIAGALSQAPVKNIFNINQLGSELVLYENFHNNKSLAEHSRIIEPQGGPQWIKCYECDYEDEEVIAQGYDGIRNHTMPANIL